MLTVPLYDDNPITRTPIVTYVLIGACTAVFLWEIGLGPRQQQAFIYSLGMIPAVLFGTARLAPSLELVPPWATIFTSMFLHGGWAHLIGNMLFLWIFGNNVEDALGRARYTLFYLACGAAAAMTQAFTDVASETPMVGASGAIAGVLGAYILLHPYANVRVFVWLFIFVRLINVPAWIMLGLWFGAQLLGGLAASPTAGGVAFWAHVGGFTTGLLLIIVLRPPGVALLQPPRTISFAVSRAGRNGWRRRTGGSVPDVPKERWDDPWR
jgi:membrane associated rhomboid family serine protease